MRPIKHQIFKYEIPYSILIEILSTMCRIENNDKNTTYIFDNNCFKKAKLNNGLIEYFSNKITPYYHKSKLHYIYNMNKMKGFANIIRQICKYYSIKIESKLTHMFSKSTKEYLITITQM